jgi:hypothetical protein
MSEKYSAIIIYLIGFDGVGKRSIALDIAKKTNIKFFDNFMIESLVYGVMNPADGLAQKAKLHINKIRNEMLKTIHDATRMHNSFIITDELFEDNADHKRSYNKILKFAEDRGSVFFPIRLVAKPEIIARRVINPSRLRRYRNTTEEKTLKKCDKEKLYAPNYPNMFSVETTKKTIHESTDFILEGIVKRLS